MINQWNLNSKENQEIPDPRPNQDPDPDPDQDPDPDPDRDRLKMSGKNLQALSLKALTQITMIVVRKIADIRLKKSMIIVIRSFSQWDGPEKTETIPEKSIVTSA